jgi:hypothetical protein
VATSSGLAEALHRDLSKQGLGELLDVRFGKAELAKNWSLDHAGADGVGADVAADQLGGNRRMKLRCAAFEAGTADVPATVGLIEPGGRNDNGRAIAQQRTAL